MKAPRLQATFKIATSVPYAGAGTRTLMVALEIEERLLDGQADDDIVAELTTLARGVLADHRARQVLTWAARDLGVPLPVLQSIDTTPEITRARQEVMVRLVDAGWDPAKVGRLLFRDQSTVRHGVRMARARREAAAEEAAEEQAAA